MHFAAALRNGEARYTPVLGLHNCPAELEWVEEGRFQAETGEYRSKAFVLRSHRFSDDTDFRQFRIGFERVPTTQDGDWWNQPDGYREVAYPSGGMEVKVKGDHYRFDKGEAWCLI